MVKGYFASAVAWSKRLTGRDDQPVELEAKGTPAGRTSEKANIAIVTDPDGNQVVFAEALTDRRGTDAQRVRG